MRKTILTCLCFFFLMLTSSESVAQMENRPSEIRDKLDSLTIEMPGLLDTLTMAVNDVTVGELIRSLAINHNLNININPSLNNQVVVTSFSEVLVLDVLVFLFKEYDLQVEFTGNILSVSNYIKPKTIETYVPNIPDIIYDAQTDLITIDLRGDSIAAVARRFTDETGLSFLYAPDLRGKLLRGYIVDSSLDEALDNLATVNYLRIDRNEEFVTFYRDLEAENRRTERAVEPISEPFSLDQINFEISTTDSVFVDVVARNIPLTEVVEGVSYYLGREFFIYDALEGTVNLNLDHVTYAEFLDYAFNGTPFSYQESNGVYLLGNQNTQGLRNTEIIKLENRTVEGLIEHIPVELSKELYLNEFLDMNALIVSGSTSRIRDLRNFVREVDQVIPMVYIEVMLVDVNKSRSLSAGISAGVGKNPQPVVSGGTFIPEVQYDLNSESVNNLINSFNGFGVINLGNVSPDFYLSVQALESEGILKTRSTPKLSALNGQEASLNIGRTEYYLEIRNDLIGTQNPTLSSSQVYKPISANTSLLVTPFVSKDEQVTLEIQVIQSDFTERISELAPPGNVQRDFKSIVRVRNGDMIILGGLDNDSRSSTGSGLPWVSRVPVLKWFFGRHTRSKSDSKLSIFLRTSIIY